MIIASILTGQGVLLLKRVAGLTLQGILLLTTLWPFDLLQSTVLNYGVAASCFLQL